MGNPLDDKVAKAKSNRPVYTYTLPAGIADGVTSVGLVALTADEEIMAARRSGNDTFRLAYELAKTSLAEVDGKPVGLADGSVDTAFNRMSSKARNLVLRAFTEVNSPVEDDVTGFLKSRQVRVG